jgi:hypothetical protein
MASIVLGGVGAAIGSAIPGIGAMAGFQIGAIAGGLLDEFFGQGQKLTDVKYSGSSYGAVIPRCWGNNRIGGNVIWTAVDSKGNSLIEHVAGGGSGVDSSSQTYYSATFAVQICPGTFTFPDGTQRFLNPELVQIWADNVLAYDTTTTNKRALVLNSNFWYYPGSETQTADPLVSASVGAAYAWAQRGNAYITVENLNLSQFGNRIPSFQFRMLCGASDLATIASDLCKMAGLTDSDIDTSLITGAAWINPDLLIQGAIENNQTSVSQTLGNLLTALACDLAEYDGQIHFVPRGGTVTNTINAEDLGAISGGGKPNYTQYQHTRAMWTDLPSVYQVTYYDIGANFEQATQSDMRVGTIGVNITQVQLPIVTSASVARQMAAMNMDFAWAEADGYTFQLPLSYLSVVPADLIYLPIQNGDQMRLRITERQLAPIGEIMFTAVVDDDSAINQVIGGGQGTGPTMTSNGAIVPTTWCQWSTPAIRDQDEGYAGLYVAACGQADGWGGCAVLISLNGGSTWNQVAIITTESVFGTALGALSSAGASANNFDGTNTVVVDVSESQGIVNSVDPADIYAGVNSALMGQEILGIETATLCGTEQYSLSNMRRGERGTPMGGHSAGELFVVLTSSITRINLDPSTVGQTVLLACVSEGQTVSDVTPQSLVIANPGTTVYASNGPPLNPTSVAAGSTSYNGTAETVNFTAVYSSTPPAGQMLNWQSSTDGGSTWSSSELNNTSFTAPSITSGTIMARCQAVTASGLTGSWVESAATTYVAPPNGGTVNIVSNEIPSGAVNGTNATFTLLHDPIAASLMPYVNGLRLSPAYFTVSGDSFTITNSGSIPATGNSIFCDYWYS